MRIRKSVVIIELVASVILSQQVSSGCTMSFSSPEQPEIEIEIEFEDYNDIRDRLFYKIEIEAEVVPPSQTTQCACAVGFGSDSINAPASFNIVDAFVGIKPDDGEGFELDAFDGFTRDSDVESQMAGLQGFRTGANAYGFSLDVDPFDVTNLGPEDRLVLGFLIELDPADFDEVNGNTIQFAAGSNEPGHPLSIFQGYQATLNLPPFRLDPCDFNSDTACDTRDLDALLALGPTENGIRRVDATEIYDLDGDDLIDLDDVDEWLEGAASYNGLTSAYKYGDANLDGAVKADDLNAIALNWQSSVDSWSGGDFNGDGFASAIDLNQLALNWQTSIPLAAVPEPSTLVLLSFSFTLLACRRRK